VLLAPYVGRAGWWLQNTSATDLWVNDTGALAQIPVPGALNDSFRVPAGATYASIPGACAAGAISIFGATSGQNFSAREY
jgi:hypothetical protein